MKLISGKEEIVYLLTKVIEKFERDTGKQVIRNSNRKNYEGVAIALSEISNGLPHTAEKLQHQHYSPDYNPKNQDYPFRKYDITGNQIKDAFFNQIVSNPRPFLVDACYIYLFGVGRKGFEKDPLDLSLIKEEAKEDPPLPVQLTQISQTDIIKEKGTQISSKPLFWIASILLAGVIVISLKWISDKKTWSTIQEDMKILPYKPSQKEIDSLEGVWLCYTGSPQARISDPNRYHLVVSNVVDVKYKDKYFTFDRYGASFDHTGYMQFEAPGLVSIHSLIKNNTDSIESPRHSLMRLDAENPYIPVISASWSFDAGANNRIIGIREVYIKQGKGGSIEEVINTTENASCRCKIIRWKRDNKEVKTFHLRNQLLDSLPDARLRSLLDENSILLRTPNPGLIIKSDSTKER